MAEKEIAESKFTGGVFGYMITNAAVVASIAFTAGLALPFALCFRERWSARNTIIEGRRHEFYGSSITLFLRTIFFLLFGPFLIGLALMLLFLVIPEGDGGGINVLGFALVPTLTFIALSLFFVWLSMRMRKWIVRHTRLQRANT